jgi:NarL family two-component system sensor histidine kinase LiaS
MQPERIRIAQELHDGIAQDLVALSYSLDLLLAHPETPVATRVELRNINFKVSEMIKSVRSEIFNLRSEASQTIDESLNQLLSQLESEIELRMNLDTYELPKHVEIELLAISRELLRNTAKHSGASVIEISINNSQNGFTYSYRDNGKGMEKRSVSGFGIHGIQERCSSIEGELSVISNEQGTQYLISIPS